ncbi:hypothetical protein [Phytohabitans kaempferiae]|uniref:Uncharacterized protein n=1 Tax=Phytohabitans kaempferiae TaxID=1620943 RepID=A0ABV6M9S9_9ACTN
MRPRPAVIASRIRSKTSKRVSNRTVAALRRIGLPLISVSALWKSTVMRRRRSVSIDSPYTAIDSRGRATAAFVAVSATARCAGGCPAEELVMGAASCTAYLASLDESDAARAVALAENLFDRVRPHAAVVTLGAPARLHPRRLAATNASCFLMFAAGAAHAGPWPDRPFGVGAVTSPRQTAPLRAQPHRGQGQPVLEAYCRATAWDYPAGAKVDSNPA